MAAGEAEGVGPVAHERPVVAERRDLRQTQVRTWDGRAARLIIDECTRERLAIRAQRSVRSTLMLEQRPGRKGHVPSKAYERPPSPPKPGSGNRRNHCAAKAPDGDCLTSGRPQTALAATAFGDVAELASTKIVLIGFRGARPLVWAVLVAVQDEGAVIARLDRRLLRPPPSDNPP